MISLETSLEISHIVRSSGTINHWVGPGQFSRLTIARSARDAIYNWLKQCKISWKIWKYKITTIEKKRILRSNSCWTFHLRLHESLIPQVDIHLLYGKNPGCLEQTQASKFISAACKFWVFYLYILSAFNCTDIFFCKRNLFFFANKNWEVGLFIYSK